MSSKADAKALKRTKFEEVFTTIRNELVDFFKSHQMPKDAVEWYSQVRTRVLCARYVSNEPGRVPGVGLQRSRWQAEPRPVCR